MNEDKSSKRIYRQPLNYENGVILPLIRDIAYWRVDNPKGYANGVITLAMILPKELRKKGLEFWNKGTIETDLTGDGKKDSDDLFVYILELLEDFGICFPRINFEVGHD